MNKILLILLFMLSSVEAIELHPKGNRVTIPAEIDADSVLKIADKLFRARKYEEAIAEYEKSADLAQIEFNRSVETEAISQLARIQLTQDDIAAAIPLLKQAGERASDSDPMGWSRFLGVKGRLEWRRNQLDEARRTFDEMYEYCSSNALYFRAVDAAHMIAIVATSPDEQIEWGRRGIEMAEKAEVESWLGPLWNNLAGTYYELKQFDSALTCYINARQYHWRFSGELAKLFADYHVGMSYRLTGNHKTASSWLRPVLAWAERIGNHSVIGQALQDLGEIEIADGNKQDGLAMLKKARAEYVKEGFDKTWPDVWNGINDRISEIE